MPYIYLNDDLDRNILGRLASFLWPGYFTQYAALKMVLEYLNYQHYWVYELQGGVNSFLYLNIDFDE